MGRIQAMKSFLPWVGGKSRLARRLARVIDATPHHCYCEPFMGAAHVFFARQQPAKIEVINDIHRELTTLFRVVRSHPQAFAACFRLQTHSRADFQRLLAADPETLTDIERAARFYYLLKTSFSGRTRTFGYSVEALHTPRVWAEHVEKAIAPIHARLQGVTIEHLDWRDLLARYDRPSVLFYLDPPYQGCEQEYGKGVFRPEDFTELAERLHTLRGRFVLSINDSPEMRQRFDRFARVEVHTAYRISQNNTRAQQPVTELVFSNLDPAALAPLHDAA